MIDNIKPGQYITRCGIVATISRSDDTLLPPFYWVGTATSDVDAEIWDRNGRYYGNGQESQWDLVARLPDKSQLDNRIERALQVLRESQTYDCHSGDCLGGMKVCGHNAGDWVEAEVVDKVRKILEGVQWAMTSGN